VLLRLTIPKLNKHKDILSSPGLALSSLQSLLWKSEGYVRPLLAASCRRMLGEAVPAVNRAVTSGLKGHLSLLATVGADHRIHLAGAIATATTTTTTAAPTPARLPAGGTALGLVGEAAAGMVLLILGRERELGSTLNAGQGLVCIGHSTTSFGSLLFLVVECETKQEYSLQFEDREDFLPQHYTTLVARVRMDGHYSTRRAGNWG
jgi:hypothetical protein